MTAATYARAARLLAADLPLGATARATGLASAALRHWLNTRRGQRALYLAVIEHHSQHEAAQITGHRARGHLPIPLVLDPEWLDELENGEVGDDATA